VQVWVGIGLWILLAAILAAMVFAIALLSNDPSMWR
jgi:hypothetical protein